MQAAQRRPSVATAVSTLESPPEVSTSKPAGKSKWVIDESENLKSTTEHRLWTFGSMAVMALGYSQALNQAHTLLDWCTVGASLLAAYVLSDLGTGKHLAIGAPLRLARASPSALMIANRYSVDMPAVLSLPQASTTGA